MFEPINLVSKKIVMNGQTNIYWVNHKFISWKIVGQISKINKMTKKISKIVYYQLF